MTDSDSDDWATEDLPDVPAASSGTHDKELRTEGDNNHDDDDDDDGWQSKLPSHTHESGDKKSDLLPDQASEGEPMIIVDMTELTNDAINSRFDPNAVNDPEAVKKLRRKIEQDYEKYAKDSSLVANRTVVPCGSSVWKSALAALRREKVGHYFCPIFPPK